MSNGESLSNGSSNSLSYDALSYGRFLEVRGHINDHQRNKNYHQRHRAHALERKRPEPCSNIIRTLNPFIPS